MIRKIIHRESNMRIHSCSALILIVALSIIQSTQAQTILSSKGVGTPFFFPNSRSFGLGGISIAVTDPLAVSRINPATLYHINSTRLSIQYFYENNKYTDGQESASSEYSNFDGFSFAIPLGSGIGISAGLAPLTRMDFAFDFQETLSGESYTKSVEGKGGLNVFTLSVYSTLRSNLAIGLSGHYIFGMLKEEWTIDYNKMGFIQSDDLFSTENRGFGFTAGLFYRPFRPLSVGAVFSPNVRLNSQTEIYHIYDSAGESHEGSISFPASWGFGTTIHIGEVGLIGGEFFQRNWTELTINDKKVQGIRNTQRLSVGCEIQPSKDFSAFFLKRWTYRLGFSYQPYFSRDPDGNDITEYWITMGLRLPFSMNIALIDVAVGFGKRGSIETNKLSEDLFRISVSLTGGEKWFIRQY